MYRPKKPLAPPEPGGRYNARASERGNHTLTVVLSKGSLSGVLCLEHSRPVRIPASSAYPQAPPRWLAMIRIYFFFFERESGTLQNCLQ